MLSLNFIVGRQTNNFTATNHLFLSNKSIEYWRFEAVYSFTSEISASALNFHINQPPRDGSCSISPLNGTTSTPFTIYCPDWFDENKIQDYSYYCKSFSKIHSTGFKFIQIIIY